MLPIAAPLIVDILSLVISGLALVVAGIAAFLTRRLWSLDRKMTFQVMVDPVGELLVRKVTNSEWLRIRVTNMGTHPAAIDTVGVHLNSGAKSEDSSISQDVIVTSPEDHSFPDWSAGVGARDSEEFFVDGSRLVMFAKGEGIKNSSELHQAGAAVVVTATDGSLASAPLPRWLHELWKVLPDEPETN
jgi:hypothetical protein